MSTLFPVVIASGFHLFPFRTEKLSPTAPMVLRKRESRSPPSYFQEEALPARLLGGLFIFLCGPMRHCFVALAAFFRRARDALLVCSWCCSIAPCRSSFCSRKQPPAQSQPESPIKSFGVCACFFLVFSLSLYVRLPVDSECQAGRNVIP